MNRFAIILAAGKGTRMKSKREDLSKVSFPILGRPMVKYVLEALKEVGCDEIVTIVGFGGETSKKIVEADSKVVWQHEQKGTGHAVMQVSTLLEGRQGKTIICCGDTPILSGDTLKKLFEAHERNGNDLTILTAVMENPNGYGRIYKEGGAVKKIIEQKDCTEEEKLINEVNAGVYIFDNEELFKDLKELTPNNAAGEYYLTDVIGMFVQANKKVGTFSIDDLAETMGVNDRYALSIASKIIQERINKKWMLSGVSIDDSASTFISPDAVIGQDTIIHPNSFIEGKVIIGEGCEIGPCSIVKNPLADGETVKPFETK